MLSKICFSFLSIVYSSVYSSLYLSSTPYLSLARASYSLIPSKFLLDAGISRICLPCNSCPSIWRFVFERIFVPGGYLSLNSFRYRSKVSTGMEMFGTRHLVERLEERGTMYSKQRDDYSTVEYVFSWVLKFSTEISIPQIDIMLIK